MISPVSVVVATRNRAGRLAGTLRRLTTLPERPPVIVIDNGSTDATSAVAADFAPQVRVLRLPSNAGATARNVGVRNARTRYVAFADDDSWWAPGALDAAARLFDRHPRLGLIAARTLVGPDEWVDPMSVEMAHSPLGQAPDLPGPSVIGFLACSAVVRRDAFLSAGGFDPVVFFFGEEARLAYDLTAAGWGLAFCDEVVAHHHPAGGCDPGKRWLARRNDLLTAWMRRPVGFAADGTVRLLREARHDPQARDAAAELIRRLPAALWRRQPPDVRVEAALRALSGSRPEVEPVA